MKIEKIERIRMILNLFDAGEGAAPAAGEAQTGETTAAPGTTRRGKSGEYANVVFGKDPSAEGIEPERGQGSAAGSQSEIITTASTAEEKRKAWQALIQGEYKDFYTEDTQKLINRRFAETKTMQDRLSSQTPIMELLAQRYGVKADDAQGLMAAIEKDDGYWQEAAEEAGLSVEAYKEMQRLRRENAAFVREQQRTQGQMRADAQLQTWYAEAESLKQRYPGFDLKTEVQDKDFLSMLRAGVPMEQAYKVRHFDQLTRDAMTTMAMQTERAVTDNVRARGTRPQENGAAAKSPFIRKSDPSKFTKKDREEIARRVAMGEKILL